MQSTSSPFVTSGRSWWLFWTLPLALQILFVLVQPGEVNHDCALLLHGAQLLLDGHLPYVGFVELNPPLITYLNVIPVAISRFLGIHPIPVFNLLVVGCVFASIVASRRLLRQGHKLVEAEIDLFLGASATYSLSLLTLPGMPFGQRDHLVLLAMLPLLIVRWLRSDDLDIPVALAATIGAFAGIALALKPFYIVLWLAPETVFWLRRRYSLRHLFRPETLAIVAIAAIYSGHFLFLPEAVRIAYFERWLPMAVAGYSAFDAPMQDLLRDSKWIRVALVAIAALCLRSRRSELMALRTPIGVTTLAGSAVYLWQHKGWDYHLVPATGFAVLALALLLVELQAWIVSRKMHASSRRWSVLILSFVILGVTVQVFRAAGSPMPTIEGAFVRDATARWIVDNTEPGDPVMILSSSVRAGYPMMLQIGRQPGSRYLCQYQIPIFYADSRTSAQGVFRYRALEETSPEERLFLQELETDIATTQPAVILVELGHCAGCPAGFTLPDYLEHNGFLERVSKDYGPGPRQDRFKAYIQER